jgi:uncharacterized protein
VANQSRRRPKSPYTKFLLAGSGFYIADNEILKCMNSFDLVIAGDISLAEQVIERKEQPLIYTKENIRS